MLLRRITQLIKNQNWFAVFLDFVIVVAGVFIGIQVANWNELKKEQQLEKQYIQNIISDLDDQLASINDQKVIETQFL